MTIGGKKVMWWGRQGTEGEVTQDQEPRHEDAGKVKESDAPLELPEGSCLSDTLILVP